MTGSTWMETGDLRVQEGLPIPLLAGQAGRALGADNHALVSTDIAAVLAFLGERCWRSGTDHTLSFSCQMRSLESAS